MTMPRMSLIFVTTLSMLIALASYRFLALGLSESFGELQGQLNNQRLAFILHVSLAPVALAIGSVQFFPSIRRRKPLHRWLGRIYGVSILVSGVAGLFVALNAAGGLFAQIGFALLAIAWVFTTANAIRFAMARRIGLHRRWMVYSFALTFAGVTLRLYLPAFIASGFSYTEASVYLAWLCWLPNLGFAFWWLNRRAK